MASCADAFCQHCEKFSCSSKTRWRWSERAGFVLASELGSCCKCSTTADLMGCPPRAAHPIHPERRGSEAVFSLEPLYTFGKGLSPDTIPVIVFEIYKGILTCLRSFTNEVRVTYVIMISSYRVLLFILICYHLSLSVLLDINCFKMLVSSVSINYVSCRGTITPQCLTWLQL